MPALRRQFELAGRGWLPAAVCAGLCLLAGSAVAHEGPPFPILMDKPAAGLVVSVWADPDIGEAKFYVVLETSAGGMPAREPQVSLWVQPVSGRLDRAEYSGQRQKLSGRMQFELTPEFDQRDMWNIGVQIKTAGGAAGELTTEIESTPPGLGIWDFAIYLFPFVLLGGMWIAGMMRRRRLSLVQRKPHNDIGADTEESNEPHCRSTSRKRSPSIATL